MKQVVALLRILTTFSSILVFDQICKPSGTPGQMSQMFTDTKDLPSIPPNEVSAMDPRFGCHDDGTGNDFQCFHLAIEYLSSLGGGTLHIPHGRYSCGQSAGAGYHNGCIEITRIGNIRIQFEPGATLLMNNLLHGGLDGTYHGIFIGDPFFRKQIANVQVVNPHIVWDPRPLRRTQGDGIHIVGSPTYAVATKDTIVVNGKVENAPQVGYGAFGTIGAKLFGLTTVDTFGNGSIFSSTWEGSAAENIDCKWSTDIGDDCVEATAYFDIDHPLNAFVYHDGREPFNSPDHTSRNNNGIAIRNVSAKGGLADGVRLGNCYECTVEDIHAAGKSVAGVILDSSVSGSIYLASIKCQVKNVFASNNKENFYISSNGPINQKGQIQGVGILAGGSGYSGSARCIIKNAPGDTSGYGATCSVETQSGSVSRVSFAPGNGYLKAPEAYIQDAAGLGATLSVTLADEFLNFRDDEATDLHLTDGTADNVLVTGGVYGFSLGQIEASGSEVRINAASDYSLKSLTCHCTRILISGSGAKYHSPIDSNTPWHHISIGKLINLTGPIELDDLRGVSASLLESDHSQSFGIYLSRLLDARISEVRISQPNGTNLKTQAGMILSTCHRVDLEKVYLSYSGTRLIPLSVGGGSNEDVSDTVHIREAIFALSTQPNLTLQIQSGPFRPKNLNGTIELCLASDTQPRQQRRSPTPTLAASVHGRSCSPVKIE